MFLRAGESKREQESVRARERERERERARRGRKERGNLMERVDSVGMHTNIGHVKFND